MSHKLKSYLDDENFLKAKKIWSEFEKKQRKYFASPQSFKDKIWNKYLLSKGFISQKFTKSEREHTTKLLTKRRGYNSQVLIKITGKDQNFNQLKSHIKYISRDGLLDVFINDPLESDNEIFINDINEIAATFQDGVYDIPNKHDVEKLKLKEKNEVVHMVFSMKGENNIPVEEIKNAAIKTIKERFVNNYFILAVHNDTDNPHCHLDLKSVDCNGKRIKISPADLDMMRDEFAKNLTDLGYKATNFSYKNKKISKNKFPDVWDGHKPHHYKITGYGEAKYNFSLDEHTEESYYVKFETSKGKETILWGKHLRQLMEDYNITNGDYARFAVTAQEPIVKKIYDKKTKQWCEKTLYRNVWDCSVEGKREVELTPLSEAEKKKTEYKILSRSNTKVVAPSSQTKDVNPKQNKTDSSKAQILQARQKVVENTTNIDSKKTNSLNKKDFNR